MARLKPCPSHAILTTRAPFARIRPASVITSMRDGHHCIPLHNEPNYLYGVDALSSSSAAETRPLTRFTRLEPLRNFAAPVDDNGERQT